ncbi:MAG: hypothetical protein GX225_04200 [Clostridiales bacterium]|nr:hypothetical protein [Clostridiales bacterium]
MKNRIWTRNPMLVDLIIGNLFFLLIGEIIIFLVFKGRIHVMLGFFVGVLASIAMVIHMAVCIDDSVRMDEHTALKHIRKTYFIRVIILVVAFVFVWIFGIGDPYAMVVGVLVLKLSAYIQPITHRLTSKLNRKGR